LVASRGALGTGGPRTRLHVGDVGVATLASDVGDGKRRDVHGEASGESHTKQRESYGQGCD